jgi:Lrp/AsnC family transcriptional regulator, leucine-responsive regulatory protein
MKDLDEKDLSILEILQENCRISLTHLAKKINLSVDSTKKRLAKLESKELFYPKVQLRPRQLGYFNILEINIKLKEYSTSKYDDFIKFLKEHRRVSQIIQLSGSWDLKITIIAKDYIDQGLITNEIRIKFRNIILEWEECLTTDVLKFEKYNLKKLKENGD